MSISRFHIFLEMDGVWPSFYPLLAPEDVKSLVLTDRHSRERVERLYINPHLLGQIFQHCVIEIIQLNNVNLFNDYMHKNGNNLFALRGITAAITGAISEQQLQTLWDQNVHGNPVTPPFLAKVLLVAMRIRHINHDVVWDMQIAASTQNVQMMKVLFETGVPLETVNWVIRQRLWNDGVGINLEEMTQLLATCPKYVHAGSTDFQDCIRWTCNGDIENARSALLLNRAIHGEQIPEGRREGLALCLAAAEGNTEAFTRILTSEDFQIIPEIAFRKALCLAVAKEHKEIYLLGRDCQSRLPEVLLVVLQDAIRSGDALIVKNILKFEEKISFPVLQRMLLEAFVYDHPLIIQSLLNCSHLGRDRQGILDDIMDCCWSQYTCGVLPQTSRLQWCEWEYKITVEALELRYPPLVAMRNILRSAWNYELSIECLTLTEKNAQQALEQAPFGGQYLFEEILDRAKAKLLIAQQKFIPEEPFEAPLPQEVQTLPSPLLQAAPKPQESLAYERPRFSTWELMRSLGSALWHFQLKSAGSVAWHLIKRMFGLRV